VGEGESCHTAQTRFLDLLQDSETNPSLAQIQEAFSVDAVTQEFFERYAELFGEFQKALDKLAAKDPAIRQEFSKKNVKPADFAKKLMGQIVFLYFIQKKGWMGVGRDGDWGTGPHDFLRRLARGEYGKYENFFNDVLEPLFYDTLATDRGHNAWCNRFNCRIPFLNGGLFEPLGDYNWRKTDIVLPNRLFTNNDRFDDFSRGTGLLDMFDRYNFTVNEAEPLEKEVAIDPEMLGKVFENLIEENLRKGLGSYYTPREIVHYMCQESLINYLDRALNSATEVIGREKRKQAEFGDQKTEQTLMSAAVRCEIVAREDIETFVHLGDQASFFEDARVSGTKSYSRHLPKSIEKHARLIDDNLADITICDPAVGSGAFPVGMMTEVVRARTALTPYFNETRERTAYRFKHDAIQNSLYGVDIDPGAIEIAKLRLWLSLVVDEEDVKQIKPLPNLFYKVVAGNSLLGVEKTLFNEKLFRRLEELKPRYFDEPDKEKKDHYKREIDRIIHELTNGKEAFDFEIYFSEVFHRNGGFDVVIANPPYGADIDAQVSVLAKLYPNTTKEYKDIYKIFIELGVGKLKAGSGTLCYIIPNTLLLQPRYKDARQFLLRHKLIELSNLGEGVFETVVVPTCVLIVQRGASVDAKVRMRNVSKGSKFTGDMYSVKPTMVEQSAFGSAPDYVFTDKLRSIRADEVPLSEVLDLKDCGIKYQRVNVGLAKKGGNDLYERLFYSGKRQHSKDRLFITGRELHRGGWFVDFSKQQYFRHDYDALLKQNEIVYFNESVFDLPEKIVWRQTSSFFVGAILDKPIWFGNTLQAGVLPATMRRPL
jgi:type I restriction-modification system DNA methylase subunit